MKIVIGRSRVVAFDVLAHLLGGCLELNITDLVRLNHQGGQGMSLVDSNGGGIRSGIPDFRTNLSVVDRAGRNVNNGGHVRRVRLTGTPG